MKIVDLDGNLINWKIGGQVVTGKDTRHRSQLHLKARGILKELYPALQIKEEVSIKLKRYQRASLDFYISKIYTVVEVHGEQHYKFSNFFHKTKASFYKSKKRDRQKIEWCELNSIKIVILPYDKEDQWKQLLKE